MGKIKSLVASVCTVLAVVALTASSAKAVPMAADLFVGGDGLLTRDAGLDWLDVDLTVGTSFDSINMASTTFASLGGLNPITDLGFRHATSTEVLTLFQNANIPVINGGFTPANLLTVEALKSLLGPTFGIGTKFEFTQGITSDGPAANSHHVPILQRCLMQVTQTGCGFAVLGTFNNALADSTGGASVPSNPGVAGLGNWLVRNSPTPIPEPGTLAILGLGLVGLGYMRRKRAA